MIKKIALLILWLVVSAGCNGGAPQTSSGEYITGAAQIGRYLPLLEGKNVGVVCNHTARVGGVHLVDTLLSSGVKVVRIFGPEHGFRGDHADGEQVSHGKDITTGIPVVSLYGKKRKPGTEDLDGLDCIVFDIQDVGVRCYTYISTMTYMMDACAQAGIPMIVLDRPNPNGDLVDGPLLDTAYASFVGLHPVPLAYGMTIGEYALMVNGEGWLTNGKQCNLTVIPLLNYTHRTPVVLPVAPSPNLPDEVSVRLYPSLVLFEGTIISVGRGTDMPFRLTGHPHFTGGDTLFVPRSIPGVSVNPPYRGDTCYGFVHYPDAAGESSSPRTIKLDYLIMYFRFYKDKEPFFTPYFTKLAGSPLLQQQIERGLDASEIRQSWSDDLRVFRTIRAKYLLYPD
ncbi:MAG: DUF1343 domain-containing protein [Bacteroidales bacterium]